MQIFIDGTDFQFDVLAVTETWHTKDNIHFSPGMIQGYYRYEGKPGSSMKGGCGFFIKDTLAYTNRPDLGIRHKRIRSEFETKWIQIIGFNNQKLIIGVIYRHPSSEDIEFYKYLNKTLKIIEK